MHLCLPTEGPSIPKAFGLTKKATGEEGSIMPESTKSGIKVMSINMLLEKDSQAVLWRGPHIANAVKMFYTDVVWGELTYLFAEKHNLEVLAKMPIDPKISEACDAGLIERYDVPHLENVEKKLENLE